MSEHTALNTVVQVLLVMRHPEDLNTTFCCNSQASARFISTDKDAGTFWLSPAQANVLAKEEDSPCFMMGEDADRGLSTAGWWCLCKSPVPGACGRWCTTPIAEAWSTVVGRTTVAQDGIGTGKESKVHLWQQHF